MKLPKKSLSLILALVLSFSLCTSAFAADVQPTKEPQYYVTALDENGSYVDYVINDDEPCEIPLFSCAVSEDGITTMELTKVATLYFYTQTDLFGTFKLHFEFVPVDLVTSLLTVGFTGTLTTHHKAGNLWGTNNFIIPVLTGSCSAASGGIGSLSGTYSVLGYDPVAISTGVYT